MKGYVKRSAVDAMERRLGVELPHLRLAAEWAPGLLPRILAFLPLAGYGRTVPKPVLHVTRIAATLAQDCGACLQIAVNVALQEEVERATVEAAVRGDAEALEEGEAVALAFGERVATGLDAPEERERLRALYGEAGVVELANAVASAQYFPVLKRALGLAESCRLDAVRYAA